MNIYALDEKELSRNIEDAREVASRNAGTGRMNDKELLAVFANACFGRINMMPLTYLEFGPYWWAVKAILRDMGYKVGLSTDPLQEKLYTLNTPLMTLFAGYNVADFNRENFMYGTRSFMTDDQGDQYVSIYDPDMEVLH
jgi:hypothetical protein